ncbi:hypothetical protein MBRU_08800 [Mycolicibacterium brumae DSM 44177]|nr:hypothetical protein MBRU_08800 [Mycolicibacterium brumae DSM 44177]
MSITGTESQVLMCCHAGENTADVLAAVGLTLGDLFDKPKDGARYDYPDGRKVYRSPDKKFRQSGNTKGRSLFRTEFPAGATVYVTEGEKCVHAAESIGLAATCSAMGAGKAHLFDWSPLQGRRVVIVADNDEPGRKHAAQVAEQLAGIAASTTVMVAAVGKDMADHVAAGHGPDELVPATPDAGGADLLDAIATFLARFVVYPTGHALTAHVLWIVHAWLMDYWESTPRIAFLSPEPGSGKSRGLEVTEPLVPRPVHAVNTSPAYLFRKVSDPEGCPTILYDEVDTVFGPRAKDNEDIRGMLNAGHRKGAMAGRCVMRGKVVETEELPAYCAVMLAGLDDLPDTIMTRSVVVRMRRRAPGEHVEPWRPRVNHPEAHRLRERLAAWSVSDAVTERMAGDFWPEIPTQVVDRDADVWEALLAVADLAGGGWPKRAREAAVALVAASKERAPSIGVLLLRDIRTVFTTAKVDQLTTEQLLSGLNGMDEAPWPTIRRGEPLDSRGLAQRLNKYGIGSKLHAGVRGVRGYTAAQFADAWSRYVPDVSATSATSAPSAPGSGAGGADVADKSQATPATPNHCGCGVELVRAESIARGCCAECAASGGAA